MIEPIVTPTLLPAGVCAQAAQAATKPGGDPATPSINQPDTTVAAVDGADVTTTPANGDGAGAGASAALPGAAACTCDGGGSSGVDTLTVVVRNTRRAVNHTRMGACLEFISSAASTPHAGAGALV